MLQHEFKVKLVTCPYPTINEFGHGLHFWGLNLHLYKMFICILHSALYEYFICTNKGYVRSRFVCMGNFPTGTTLDLPTVLTR